MMVSDGVGDGVGDRVWIEDRLLVRVNEDQIALKFSIGWCMVVTLFIFMYVICIDTDTFT